MGPRPCQVERSDDDGDAGAGSWTGTDQMSSIKSFLAVQSSSIQFLKAFQ